MPPTIKVENLGKCYRLYHEVKEPYTTLRDTLSRKAKQLFNRSEAPTKNEDFWALKDVSFEVQKGDVLGIIGRNGAGKSTLLKILSRITQPTEGKITIRGRVASLLEVGTGFHSELSGRENIYLNGAILGMSRAEINSKFDEIVAFAEVEKFLDTPVKRYSSGMHVRLAFAVAAHLNPEILIVDEVLAVGDIDFQKKCLGQMQNVAKSGRTVIFVSHDIGAVTSLCKTGLLLKSGRVQAFGSSAEVVHSYLTHGPENLADVRFDADDRSAGDDVIRIRRARIIDDQGYSTGNMSVSESSTVEVVYEIFKTSPVPHINLHFYTEEGSYAFATIENTNAICGLGVFTSVLTIPKDFLNAKKYYITIFASSFNPTRVHVEMRDVIALNVFDNPGSVTRQGYLGPFHGTVRPLLNWKVCSLNEAGN